MTSSHRDPLQRSAQRRWEWFSAALESLSPASGSAGVPVARGGSGPGPSLSSWGSGLTPLLLGQAGSEALVRGALPSADPVAAVLPRSAAWNLLQSDPALTTLLSPGVPRSAQKTPAGPVAAGAEPSTAVLCGCALCQGGAASTLLAPRQAAAARAEAPPDLPQASPAKRWQAAGQPQAAGPSGSAAGPSAAVAASLVIADADVFNLETNPGASKTIYLNFLGANLSGTAWVPSGSSWNGVAPAFTLDADTSTNFSAVERAAIKEIFARVACDYAPLNVNVTTKVQAADRISRTSSSDTVYGTVCLFSNISSQSGYANSGGVAYIGVFNDVNAERLKPALVFPDKLGTAKNIAEAASHEVGHNLNLRHDGAGSAAYYEGQGSAPGWAPIMGVGYYRELTQFSRGSYSGATNLENDFSRIASEGVGYWLDAVGNDRATASALTLTDANADGVSDRLRVGGAIELTASNGLGTPDRDFYRFLAPSNGSVSIDIRNALAYFDPAAGRYTYAPVPSGFGNLRLDAQLQDASGRVLADWSGNSSLDVTNLTASNLLAGQNYYLSVFANLNSPDGEDAYGSLGDYVIDLVYQGQPPGAGGAFYGLTVPASVKEGELLTIAINATNVINGTTLNWRFSGAGVDSSDFNPATLSGTVTVNGGSASVAPLIVADNKLEPTETALFELLDGTTVVASSSVDLVDTNRLWGTTASDSIVGTPSRFESITGVLASGTVASALGTGQIDAVTGGVGADEFLLSELRSGVLRVFYNDNSNSNTGTSDYLRVLDFNASEDKLRFASGRYFSRNNGSNTWIWYDRNNNGLLNSTNFQSSADELVAVLSGVNLGSATIVSGSAQSPSWAVFG